MDQYLVTYGEMLISKLHGWFVGFVELIPNILLSVFIVILFYLGAKLVQRPVLSATARITDNAGIANLLGRIVFLAVFFFGISTALSILQLERAVTSMLAGAGVIGLALGFAFQEIATNFVSGVLISIQRPYKAGDIVEIGSYLGRVHRIDLRVTVLHTFQGLEVLIPNKEMYTSSLINYTSTPDRRIDFEMGISYGDNLERVEQIAKEALQSLDSRTERDVELYFKGFGDSSINFVLHVWITYPGENNYWRTHHQIVTRLKRAFDENGITIPFPIRTLDFGIKGGTPLHRELSRLSLPSVQ